MPCHQDRCSERLWWAPDAARDWHQGPRSDLDGTGLRRTQAVYNAAGTAFETIGYTYGSSASINDNASRVETVTVGTTPTTVASYRYLGLGHLVGTTLDQPDVGTSVYTSASGSHTYADLDEFGRPVLWDWQRGGSGVATTSVAITYDRNSNPTSAVDATVVRASSSKHLFDAAWSMDGLNRLIHADEGHLASGVIQSGYRTREELWNSLSLTGNWGNRRLDANGDGDFTDEDDRDEPLANNVFNAANEWIARRVAKSGGDKDEYAYTHDAVGNLTRESCTITRGVASGLAQRDLIYDAFGRLTEVRDTATSGFDFAITRYRYNGLGHRTLWHWDVDGDLTLENAERQYLMYDERWRNVASR